MPLIQVNIRKGAYESLGPDFLDNLCKELEGIVEGAFDIRDKGDVESRVIVPTLVYKGRDIEVEVDYTVGVGEYQEGVLFEPTERQRIFLCDEIIICLARKLTWTNVQAVSVWVRPFAGTTYRDIELTQNTGGGEHNWAAAHG